VVRGVQGILTLNHKVTLDVLSRNVWGSRGWVPNGLARKSSQGMSDRLDAAQQEVHLAFRRFFRELSFWERHWILFRVMHPLQQLQCIDTSMSSMKRAKLVVDALLGSLVISALFFSATKSVMTPSSPEECIDNKAGFARFVVMGMLSAIFVRLPIGVVMYLHLRSFVDEQQRGTNTSSWRKCFWCCTDAWFWLFGTAYSSCFVFYLTLFSSNMHRAEEWKWCVTFISALCKFLVVSPLLTSTGLLLLIELRLFRQPDFPLRGDDELGISFEEEPWTHPKVVELAHRGISVQDLLNFYKKLGSEVFPHYDPEVSTTHDVVRHAIIPLSRDWGSYAMLVSGDKPRLASKMVTHNWGNRFAHLLAAIFADALGHRTYSDLLEMMVQPGGIERLEQKLHTQAQKTYWVCAFSVNQHAGICDSVPQLDTHGKPFVVCPCGREKFWKGDFCEMNKFDSMMAYLKRQVPGFAQVIAVDSGFELFTRIWCIAELLQARNSHLPQALKIHSEDYVIMHREDMESMDVRNAQATFAPDRDMILAKVDDIDEFNREVRNLILAPDTGLLAMWTAGSVASVVGESMVDQAEEIALTVASSSSMNY